VSALAANAQVSDTSDVQKSYLIALDRFEVQAADQEETALWDVEAWAGGASNRLWLKSEGEYSLTDSAYEQVDVQALVAHAVLPDFFIQAGVRRDIQPTPHRTHAVLGFEGDAAYGFELEGAVFVSHKGGVTLNFEIENEIPLTEHLLLLPRIEIDLATETMGELEIGKGMTEFEAGLRLHYEIHDRFAPYIGVTWTRLMGDTADFARDDDEDVDTLAFVMGVRMAY